MFTPNVKVTPKLLETLPLQLSMPSKKLLNTKPQISGNKKPTELIHTKNTLKNSKISLLNTRKTKLNVLED